MRELITIGLLLINYLLQAQSTPTTAPYPNSPSPEPNLVKYDFYIDSIKPSFAQTLTILPSSTNNVTTNYAINLGSAGTGVHQLFVKVTDANGVASMFSVGRFVITDGFLFNNPPLNAANITKYEFYIDSIKPAYKQELVFTPTNDHQITNTPINLGATGPGVHSLLVKSIDVNGVSSFVNAGTFSIVYNYPNAPNTSLPNIVQLEYSIDAVTAHGAGTQVPITPATDIANIDFNPSTVGLSIGEHFISVRTKDAQGVWSLTNTKKFIVPNVSANPNQIDFGNVATGLTKTINLQIVNNGVTSQSISSVTTNAPFSTTYTGGAIPNNGSVNIPVTFSPTAILSYSDTIFVQTTAGLIKVPLKGNGVAAVAAWSASNQVLNLDNVTIGQTSSQTITITNNGTLPLTIASITSSNSSFAATASNTDIPVGGTVNLTVSFTPTVIGPSSGLIKLTNNVNTNDTITLNVSGIGTSLASGTISLYAEAKNENIQLNWTTDFEINSKQFEIEHKTSEARYAKIATINAAGNSNSPRAYTFTHNNAPVGKNYYRVKEIDVNGSYKFSNIAVVNLSKLNEIVIYPNPVIDVLHLKQKRADKINSIEIYSSNGKLVKSIQNNSNINIQRVDVSELPKGFYLINVKFNNYNEVFNFVKE